jgi:iron complex transport system ATP-binding protein
MPARTRARKLAFMSQESGQTFPFTVLEILLMGRYPHMRRFEQETPGDRERARRMLSYVGLPGLQSRAFGELSGGERQLVLFAKALVQDTPVLVLDEPSSNLDIKHQDRIFSMAQELAREGRAVVASVHNLGVAAHYCTRLILMDKGRISAAGRPEDVLRSELLDRVYGIRTIVSPSLATGSLTVAVVPENAGGAGPRVHLIGGAGSAVNLTRELYRLGYQLSGGIAHEHDSDEELWRSLGVECERVGAFSRIGDDDVARAARLVERADLTILCSFPVGQGNLGNLRLAALAARLIILAPGAGDVTRSFFAHEGRALFDELQRGARVLSYDALVAELEIERGRATGQDFGAKS